MSYDSYILRDLLSEIIALVNSGHSLSDIHIEQDAPLMIKSPRGWQRVSEEEVTLDDMIPVLRAIDQDWEDKIIKGAIDRPFMLIDCRLRCNVFRANAGNKVSISVRRLPLHPIPLEKLVCRFM